MHDGIHGTRNFAIGRPRSQINLKRAQCEQYIDVSIFCLIKLAVSCFQWFKPTVKQIDAFSKQMLWRINCFCHLEN